MSKRISFHVPYDLTEAVQALADRDGTPASKWLAEIIRREVRMRRQALLNPYPASEKSFHSEGNHA
jgi:hypothetical protein